MTEPGDAVLVERIRRGEAEALEALISRYGAGVPPRPRHHTSRGGRSEVVQDVFLSVFRKIGAFGGRSGIWPCIYRVTANAALTKGRGQRAKREISLDGSSSMTSSPGWSIGSRSGVRRCPAGGEGRICET